jgi:hypothetical protein
VMKAATRRRIPASKFVYKPGTRTGGKHGAYPINTRARARAALAYAGQKRTKGSYSTVAKAVKKRYPDMNVGGKKRKKK